MVLGADGDHKNFHTQPLTVGTEKKGAVSPPPLRAARDGVGFLVFFFSKGPIYWSKALVHFCPFQAFQAKHGRSSQELWATAVSLH